MEASLGALHPSVAIQDRTQPARVITRPEIPKLTLPGLTVIVLYNSIRA